MKHEDLKNKIEGSILKQEYLEAFLLQSAYIESLLKLFVDYELFFAAKLDKVDKAHDSDRIRLIEALREKVGRYGFYDLVELLYESERIDKEMRNLLDNYRKKRNNIFHDLLKSIQGDGFDAEIKDVCQKGRDIIHGEKFAKMVGLVDYMEKKDDEVGERKK